MRDTTIAVVTALSPSGTTLAEYGYHLLGALGRKPGVRIVALVEHGDLDYPDIPGVELVPAWRFGSPANPWRIARAARQAGADVVLFNSHFTSFGSGKVAATLGLLSPLAVRARGIPTITLLHNIVETVDLGAAGFGAGAAVERALRFVGSVVTWLVLRSNVVTTTMPRYVEILRSKYRARNVALTPHGSFEATPPPSPPPPTPRVMAFGKFGTYKRVEPLIEAVRMLERPEVELVIAGTDSPNTPGYLADVEARLGGADVVFTGYVPEEAVEAVFRNATVTVFPYAATTGSSGVLHQAGAFGCPPVLPLIGDLRDLIEDEGYTGVFFDPADLADLARALSEVIDDPGLRREIAVHNHRAARGLPIDDVADWYLVHASRLVHGDPTALLAGTARDVSR
jgi:glycosyltransferase involved in cell wall biosynthesis